MLAGAGDPVHLDGHAPRRDHPPNRIASRHRNRDGVFGPEMARTNSNTEVATHQHPPRVFVLLSDDRARALPFLAGRIAGPSLQWIIIGEWPQEFSNTNPPVFLPVREIDATGARQKMAGRLAIEHCADLLVVVEASVADPVSAVNRVARTFSNSKADIVIDQVTSVPRGTNSSALTRRLTAAAERLSGCSFDDGACRGYSTSFLRQVPFELNRDDALFNADILLQAIHVGAKICSTNADEQQALAPAVSEVFPSAPKLFLTALQFRMHRMGMLCALRYRNLTPVRYQDKTFMLYSSHALALKLLRRERPVNVLDIGCGPGYIARQCEQSGIRVTGLDSHEPLPGMMSEFHRLDLEIDPLPIDPFSCDCVLMLDLIEHMADPEAFLLMLRNCSKTDKPGIRPPLVIISTPNVAFAAIRFNLMLGRFNYAERGILDITHKRLFTRSTLTKAIRDCGYNIEQVLPVGVPFETVVGGRIGKILGTLAGLLARIWPTMFAFQFVVSCRPTPGVHQVFARDTQRHPCG
jgi:2-polyprenyl-3-methyl-5-hydroxy-6-metoxy-1,4-benzoquinol methylase